MAKPPQDPVKRDVSTLRRLLESTEPLTVRRLGERMRVAGRTVAESLTSLEKQGLATFEKRGGETYWSAAEGASPEQLGASVHAVTGYEGSTSLRTRPLTPARADDDFDDLDAAEGYL